MTQEELNVLAWTLLGEAAGEGTTGLTAVAHVIRNRAASGRFPSNPAAVALQSNSVGVHQFSAWNALGNGGNIPRARFPVGSTEFNRAIAVVNRVFGPTPGRDPTQGATHYYAPQGMAGGNEPYWWSSEAPRGGKKIGNHIFAIRRDEAEAPTPARRSITDIGNGATAGQLTVFRTGRPVQLPNIGPSGGPSLRTAPQPARMSARLQDERLPAGATPVATTSMVYDPVTRALVPRLPTAAQVRRSIPQSQIERAPARTVQRTSVAGFSVPNGTGGIAAIDPPRNTSGRSADAAVAAQRREQQALRARPNTQTTFAPPVNQPAGSLVNKPATEERLTTQSILPTTVGSRGLSRDAVAAQQAGIAAAAALRTPPPPRPRPQRAPVPVPVPPRAPLEVTVHYASNPVAEVIAQRPVSAVQQLRDEGYSPSEAYSQANQNASDRAIANAAPGYNNPNALWRNL